MFKQEKSAQEKVTHFRAWKSEKAWLYSASVFTAALGGGIASQILPPSQIGAYAATVTASNSTDSASAAANSPAATALSSSVSAVTAPATSTLSSAASQASAAGITVSSSVGSAVTISLAQGSAYAASVASSIAAMLASETAMLSSLASSAYAAQSNYAAVSSAIDSANSAALSAASQASAAQSNAMSSLAASLGSINSATITVVSAAVTPSYVTLSLGATADQIASAATANASIYSSAVASANSVATSQASSIAATVQSLAPSSVAGFTLLNSPAMIGTGTATSGFVSNPTEIDSTAAVITAGSGAIMTASYANSVASGTQVTVTSNGSAYPANWGSANSLATPAAYVATGIKAGTVVQKNYANIGTLDGKTINAQISFTVDKIQGSSNASMVISDNITTFITANGFNGHFTVTYTYADGTALSLADINKLAMLVGSLSDLNQYSSNGGYEYTTTNTAKDAIVSSNKTYPTNVSPVAVTGTNLGLPTGVNTIFESTKWTTAANDNNYNNYAYLYGTSFTGFNTTAPTFYFGDVTNTQTIPTSMQQNHLMFMLETSPFSTTETEETVITPVAAAVYTAPSTPATNSATIVTIPVIITASAPNLDAPASANGSINTPFDLTQGGMVTGNDNGTTVNYNSASSPVSVTITAPNGTTVTIPAGATSFTPTMSGNYTIQYNYTSGNGSAQSTTNLNVTVPIAATGTSVIAGANSSANLTNTVTPTTGATITNVSVGNIAFNAGTGANGTNGIVVASGINPNTVTTNPNGQVVFPGQSTAGVYTFPVTYTDSTGASVTVQDTVNVAPDTYVITTQVNAAATAEYTYDVIGTTVNSIVVNSVQQYSDNGSGTGITGTYGSTPVSLPINNVTISLADQSATLLGQSIPGAYVVNLTYTVTNALGIQYPVTVTDYFIVQRGNTAITNVGNSVSMNNELSAMPSTDLQAGGLTSTVTPTITSIIGPDGSSIPTSAATVNSNGAVTLSGQTTPGAYTINISSGTTQTYLTVLPITVAANTVDTVYVLNGQSVVQTTNTPATIQSIVPIEDVSTATIGTVTSSNGGTLPASATTINADGSITLAGQATPGVYLIPVTYTDTTGNQTTIYNAVSVSNGAQVTVPSNTSTVLVNTLTPTVSTTTNPDGSVTMNTATIATATVGTILYAPDVSVAATSNNPTAKGAQVTVGTDGTVNFVGNPTPGVYTIPVTYTDSVGNSFQVQDVITVTPPITVASSAGVVTNTDTEVTVNNTINAGTPAVAVTVTSATNQDGDAVPLSDVSVNKTGAVTLTGQPNAGIYTIDVSYTDAGGNTANATDVIAVSTGTSTVIGADDTAQLTNTLSVIPGNTISTVTVGTITSGDGSPVPGTAQVTANPDGTVTVTGLNTPGTYTIPITYLDNAGNTTKVVDTVTVVNDEVTGTTATITTTAGTATSVNNPITPGVVLTSTSVTGTNLAGNPIPASAISVDNNGNVTLAPQTTPGDYTINVNYTDSNGNVIPVTDIISVSDGTTTTTIVNVPIVTNNPVYAAVGAGLNQPTVTDIQGPIGSTLQAGDITFNLTNPTQVMVPAQTVPGTYTIDLVYTDTNGNVIPVTDVINVAAGIGTLGSATMTTVTTETTTIQNNLMPIGIIPSDVTINSISGPNGLLSPSDATADAAGKVVLNEQTTPGIYLVNVTYTDSSGNAVTVVDQYLVNEGTTTTGTTSKPTELENIPTLIPGVAITGASVGMVTDANGNTYPSSLVTTALDGTNPNQYTLPVTLDTTQLAVGIYSVPVTYTDSMGETYTVIDVFNISAGQTVATTTDETLTTLQNQLTPITGNNVVIAKVTDITTPAGSTLQAGDITVDTVGNVHVPTLTTPGTYVIDVAYTDNAGNVFIVPDTINVSGGASTQVKIDQANPSAASASLTNTVTPTDDQSVTDTTIGTITALDQLGNVVDLTNVTVTADTEGNVNVSGLTTLGTYDVPVSYLAADGTVITTVFDHIVVTALPVTPPPVSAPETTSSASAKTDESSTSTPVATPAKAATAPSPAAVTNAQGVVQPLD
ncbi:large repetitive protein [Weissella oryzae SG25]|uniref:Large repetitive protein n=1 Tax=Weissella oryzae (strain DSM 25784 / JCM 18191 / LMG 30913 / SG25) TaxID=1329250 RepID=A0A069D0M1_WEIOS|nr:hypothetical protein [Weissella oryzae]GAK30861.1 large repetitive protein [Weissella oryzae SG25]